MDVITKNEIDLEAAALIHKKRRIKKIFTAVLVVGILISILFMAGAYGYNAAMKNAEKAIAAAGEEASAAQSEVTSWQKKYQELVETPIVIEPVTPEIVQKVLAANTAEISELASAEYIFTNAAKFTDTAHIAKVFDWMTEKSFIQKWDGKIKAGIDLSKVEVSVEGNAITIVMPYTEILSYEIDMNSVEVLDEKSNIFNPISVQDKVNFDRETEYSMKARAVENGLLSKAQKNAENIIRSLLLISIENIEDYTINFVTMDK